MNFFIYSLLDILLRSRIFQLLSILAYDLLVMHFLWPILWLKEFLSLVQPFFCHSSHIFPSSSILSSISSCSHRIFLVPWRYYRKLDQFHIYPHSNHNPFLKSLYHPYRLEIPLWTSTLHHSFKVSCCSRNQLF